MPSSYITTTNKLKIAELDFDAIKSTLIEYLRAQDEFKDYDFVGSAMNILMDILAYNTHYNGFYANMIASEMFMDSASLRSSVVSLAKHLGYTPASRKGASVEVDISFDGETEKPDYYIPKNSKFVSKIGKDIHTFLTTDSYVITPPTNIVTGGGSGSIPYSFRNIRLKEGIAFTSTQTVLGTTNEMFKISDEHVDVDTLTVSVEGDIYQKVDDITEINSESKVYFLQEGTEGQYEIYFGNGILGKELKAGDTVLIGYNVSVLGSEGNGAKDFVLAQSLAGGVDPTTITITLSDGFERASGGAEREAVSTIRMRSPQQHALQKRVVTASDYRTRLENDYNVVESVRVWGGEENEPPQYGSVFVSIKPKTGYVLSRAEINRISNDILKKRNMVTVTPRFVEPDYLFIVVDATVSYDPRKTNQSPAAIKTLVETTIANYGSTHLGKFDEYFRHSVLAGLIDDSAICITNNNTTIAIKKRIRPRRRVEQAYRIHFDNPLYRPEPNHRNILQSSLFNYRGWNDCSIIDFNGDLQIVTVSPISGFNIQSWADYRIIRRGDVGFVDYGTGEIWLDSFRPLVLQNNDSDSVFDKEHIYFAAKPRINDIIPKENTIITIEKDDITVNVIDDTNRIPENRTRGY